MIGCLATDLPLCFQSTVDWWHNYKHRSVSILNQFFKHSVRMYEFVQNWTLDCIFITLRYIRYCCLHDLISTVQVYN